MTTVSNEPETAGKSLSNLSVRMITALALLPFVLWSVFSGGWPLSLLVLVLAVIAALEFYLFAHGRLAQGSSLVGLPVVVAVIIAFQFRENGLWVAALIIGGLLTFILETLRHPGDVRRSLWQVGTTLAGVLYIAFPAAFLIVIRSSQSDSEGLLWLLVVCSVTWGTDTFAYLGGRFFGKTKLAPTLSPKKTVEGAIVGIFGGIIPTFILLGAAGELSLSAALVVGIGPLMAILGDLFESALKRFFHIKDSHVQGLNIFPGHGGVLDRIDSLIWVSALFYFYLALSGFLSW